jgi:hypothetical protein
MPAPGGLDPVQIGHRQVHHDDVRAVQHGLPHRLSAGRGLRHHPDDAPDGAPLLAGIGIALTVIGVGLLAPALRRIGALA